jgi:hypothetical protein
MNKLITLTMLLIFLTVNAYAGTYMFRDKADNIDRWLEAKGESGSTYDMLFSQFSGFSTLSVGSLYDHVDNVMVQFGYSGTLQDKLTGFFEATTSQRGRGDAERSFWANDSYSFDPNPSEPGNFVFVDTNNFTFIDGNNFTFGS